MDVLWIMLPFLGLVLIAFFLVVFFLPEWVGITGKHAKSITAHQQGDEPEPPGPDITPPAGPRDSIS